MSGAPERLRFALASCAYPAGLLDRPLAARPWDALLAIDPSPEFLAFTGDQIYVDATAGLFDPEREDSAIETIWNNDAAPRRSLLAGSFIEIYSMLDDHEIVDNWEPEDLAGNAARCEHARAAFAAACRRHPGKAQIQEYKAGMPLWYHFDHESGHRFFFVDSRTTRSRRNADALPSATIIDEPQYRALKRWLRAAPPDVLSFVVCPSIVLPRRLATARDAAAALLSDAWDGYPASLHSLLALLHELDNPRIVFLSGDEHIGCAADFQLRGSGQTTPARSWLSLHSPAMFAPYPFANGNEWNFARHETFRFRSAPGADEHECHVDCTFSTPGNGFVVIDVGASERGELMLSATFHATDRPEMTPLCVARSW